MKGWELIRASVDGLVKAIESGRNDVFSNYRNDGEIQRKDRSA